MTTYILGLDIGGSKTHALIADERGQIKGFGQTGPGNYEVVGWDGLRRALQTATTQALVSAGLTVADLAGAGFGVAGYDWPSERQPTLEAIETLGLPCPFELVNDTVIGLLAGARDGFGVAIVAGTGCNCWGRDRAGREGRVTGSGPTFGEYGGGSELVRRAVQAISRAWSKRGPETALTQAFVELAGMESDWDLIEKLATLRYRFDAAAARTVFAVAAAGDPVARDLIRWLGQGLGDLALGVIRQLGFEQLTFDVVLAGSIFNAGPPLLEPLRETIQTVAPGARLAHLAAPPVVGAVLLGMTQAGLDPLPAREPLISAALEIEPLE